MSVESAFQRLRDANPVSDPAALRERPVDSSVFLAATQQRSMEMQTEHEVIKTKKAPTRSRRNWIPALVAVVVVIIAGVSILLFTRDTGSDVADGGPEATARRFIDARNAWDGEAAVALFAPDAVISGDFAAAAEDYPALFDWLQAADWQWTVEECSVTAAGPPAEVTCTYTQENAWSRALEVETGTGSFDFTTSNGQILKLNNNLGSDFYTPVWGQFYGWVFTTHREDIEVMYYAAGNSNPRLTPESIALWEEYTNEFVASVRDSGTP